MKTDRIIAILHRALLCGLPPEPKKARFGGEDQHLGRVCR